MQISDFYTHVLHITDPELVGQLSAVTQARRIARGEFLVREGEPQPHISFLLSGILRGFFLDINGRDITDCFGFHLGTPTMASFDLQAPSPSSIESLTEAEVLLVPVETALRFLEQDPRLVQVYSRLLQSSLHTHWQIKTMLHQRTAMERYQWFLEAYPGLIDQVTNRHVASFLGMVPRHAQPPAAHAAQRAALASPLTSAPLFTSRNNNQKGTSIQHEKTCSNPPALLCAGTLSRRLFLRRRLRFLQRKSRGGRSLLLRHRQHLSRLQSSARP